MITVEHLTKCYGDFLAVDDLSFEIDEGHVYGFLGPNGAGKSTTMNIMTGCLAASEGEVRIDGHDIFEEPQQAKRLIGYLPEKPPLYLDRTPREYLTFVGRAKGIKDKALPEQIGRVMEVTQITDVADRLIKHLSKGYRQRVGIAQALLGDPEVVILDEPTVGLDPKQIIEIRSLIQSLGQKHTVILSSHILSEVQAVCQTILIISKGHLVACDTPENLERLFSGSAAVDLTVEAGEAQTREILAPLDHIRSVDVRPEGTDRCQVTLETDGDEGVCRAVFFAFSRAGRAILRMTDAKASLEDIFIELTSGEAADAPAEAGSEDDGEEVDEP